MEWNPDPVEAKIGIHFKTPDTLLCALIHRSYAEQISGLETDNERLKFLGNAILNLVVSDYLYHQCPYLEVGNWSALRDKLIEGERLTKVWFQLGLGESYPFLALEEERHRLRQQRHNPFEEAFVALVGAIHLDRGFSQTRNWLVKNLIAPVLERHLKKTQERCSPNKQLKFLGDSLLKAIVIDYLYRHLPCVSESRLAGLYREFASNDRLAEYSSQLKPEDLTMLRQGSEDFITKPFKVLLSAVYVELSASDDKRSFPKTCEWFVGHFLDEDEVLRRAIALLLEDGKPQKWIIRHVMGYESKDYNEGRERFNLVLEGQKA
ncbi:MAG TPA: ribonuclease III domain-containing protein [Candidatus Sericytochromatia bacterium]|jgi:dsRNA-specific ribonuclease